MGKRVYLVLILLRVTSPPLSDAAVKARDVSQHTATQIVCLYHFIQRLRQPDDEIHAQKLPMFSWSYLMFAPVVYVATFYNIPIIGGVL
ncbi:MAG: hypothetical protein JOZ08_11870 [Verrucomicrobia bacterium]|nr:hypothetical protein [Verrucomicrobiota bacterium]